MHIRLQNLYARIPASMTKTEAGRRAVGHTYSSIQAGTHAHIYVMCVCVCVCPFSLAFILPPLSIPCLLLPPLFRRPLLICCIVSFSPFISSSLFTYFVERGKGVSLSQQLRYTQTSSF